jgi:hypothetical protein
MAFVELINKVKNMLTSNKQQRHSSILNKTYSGNAIVVDSFENNVSYVNKNNLSGHVSDDVTDWTARFGYKNGHPCMFITFTAINPNFKNSEHILCLEFLNPLRGFTPRIHALNVYKCVSEHITEVNTDLKNITWISMSDITVNTEYCIYIIANEFISRKGYHRHGVTMNDLPSDWHVRLNLRPTIRSTIPRCKKIYNFQKNMIDFTYVDYLLTDEYQID